MDSAGVVVLGTGAHCEVDLSHNCSHDTCVGGARCVPLIRGGFRCELCRRGVAGRHAAPSSCVECDSVDERSPFCELLSRGFTRRGSFLMFPPLKQRHRFHIKLRSVNQLNIYTGQPVYSTGIYLRTSLLTYLLTYVALQALANAAVTL